MRKHFSRECLAYVESLLRGYPALCRELTDLERYIRATVEGEKWAHSGSGRGSDAVSVEERFFTARERNPRWQRLSAKTERIRRALAHVRSTDGRNFVTMRYVKDMPIHEIARRLCLSERRVFEIREKVLCDVVPEILPDEA